MNAKILLLLLLFATQFLTAQTRIGIGTNNPQSSAALDITSTNKGFLVPRLTQSARLAIPNPTNGLLVYDSTLHRLYQFQEGEWRFMLTNQSWTQANTRNWIYSSANSIGIGVSVPTEKLDVNGKIQARGDVIADANIDAGSNITAGSFTATGNAVVNAALTAQGDVVTYSDLNLDDVGPTIQLQSVNVKYGFFQLAGNDLRLGTNSGNTSGKVIFRMDQTDVMSIDRFANIKLLEAGTHKGEICIGWKLCRFAAPNINMLPVLFGLVPADGGPVGWASPIGYYTWAKTATGKYEITSFLSDISFNSAIIVTPSEAGRICTATYISSGKFRVETFTRTGTPVDCAFTYVVNDPNN
ncbi:MAG: hypothetical protein LH615_02670 [Ferruginibacter sp.]|nr:hypothetical protein [Ferruginibacter sp.]